MRYGEKVHHHPLCTDARLAEINDFHITFLTGQRFRICVHSHYYAARVESYLHLHWFACITTLRAFFTLRQGNLKTYATLFLRLGLKSTLILRHENAAFSLTLFKPEEFENSVFEFENSVLVWTESILKAEAF